MISLIIGKTYLIQEKDRSVTILTGAGIGYKIYVPNTGDFNIGDTVELYTITVVREDVLDLYGFATPQEKELCELLMSVSGIGPKTALGIVQNSTPELLVSSLTSRNITYLSSLPGIGKKGAEKMCLELEQKVKNLTFNSRVNSEHSDLIETLIAMGYNPKSISEIISTYQFQTLTLQSKIKEALLLLSQQK